MPPELLDDPPLELLEPPLDEPLPEELPPEELLLEVPLEELDDPLDEEELDPPLLVLDELPPSLPASSSWVKVCPPHAQTAETTTASNPSVRGMVDLHPQPEQRRCQPKARPFEGIAGPKCAEARQMARRQSARGSARGHLARPATQLALEHAAEAPEIAEAH